MTKQESFISFVSFVKYSNYAICQLATTTRKALIALKPINYGFAYQQLHDQTNVSGYEMFLLESTNNFQNPFAEGMQDVYNQRGWFALILRDVVRKGGTGTDDKGRLHLTYISHVGTEWEQSHNVWAPKTGFYVTNDDCETINGIVIPFRPGTLVPYETLPFSKKNVAIKRLEAKGIPREQLSGFYQLDSSKDDTWFASRVFSPGFGDGGRFSASLGRHPSCSGDDRVASLRQCPIGD